MPKYNTCIFVDGCFWHKCPKCYREPKSNKQYWIPKIENNATRDVRNKKLLKVEGFKNKVIWEHEVKKDFENVVRKLMKYGISNNP